MKRTLALASLIFPALVSCASGSSSVCTCAADEKFNGTECVAAADFVAPDDCVEDEIAVCGCDEKAYTSKCTAFAEGVQVQNEGACSASGGGGGGFGW